ncbi:hypothetical protein JCM33374_g2450 [Metschnikowia sp. JCM 33374]|nr:hypothetical protein JCM33374_g2450 [Metschnikowia sp. JCM 33374]
MDYADSFHSGNALAYELRKSLQNYRGAIASLNDDTHGTGAVVMASVTAAFTFRNRDFRDIQVHKYGGSSASLGTVDQIVNHMCSHGSTVGDACSNLVQPAKHKVVPQQKLQDGDIIPA